MRIINFQKEKLFSKSQNSWPRRELSKIENLRFISISGFSQNKHHQTTHILERAHVDLDIDGVKSKEAVLSQIVDLETGLGLQMKINFAAKMGLPLHYVLHNSGTEKVYLLSLSSIADTVIEKVFDSYQSFAGYIAEIKGWVSKKEILKYKNLPKLDNTLRAYKSPWPANIDCIACDRYGNPIAIIEFQNAKKVAVAEIEMNDYFLCKKMKKEKVGGYTKTTFFDDIRRWMSLEILRVQSGLPLFNIVWSPDQSTYQINKVEQITFPDFATYDTTYPWKNVQEYKTLLHSYINDPNDVTEYPIRHKKSMSFWTINNRTQEIFHKPPLTLKNKTFPHIYWKKKRVEDQNNCDIQSVFLEMIN